MNKTYTITLEEAGSGFPSAGDLFDDLTDCTVYRVTGFVRDGAVTPSTAPGGADTMQVIATAPADIDFHNDRYDAFPVHVREIADWIPEDVSIQRVGGPVAHHTEAVMADGIEVGTVFGLPVIEGRDRDIHPMEMVACNNSPLAGKLGPFESRSALLEGVRSALGA